MKHRPIRLTPVELSSLRAVGNRRIAIGLALFALGVFVIFIIRHGWTFN